MKLRSIITGVLLIFSISNSVAQDGWIEGEIFLKNGESKAGLIKLGKVSKDLIAIGGDNIVKYKPAKKGKKKKYREPEIDHIILDEAGGGYNGYYEYVAVSESKRQLFRAVLTGNVILYHRFVNMTSSSAGGGGMMMSSTYNVDEYYVLREGGTIAMPLITGRISKSFRHRASNFFSDCPIVVAKLQNKSYRKRDIEKVVAAYNNCEISK